MTPKWAWSARKEEIMRYDDETFGVVEDEEVLRMSQLRALDEDYAKGVSYPECPRCEGEREINVITRMNGPFERVTEYISCPLCSGTGEADAERAEEWLLDKLDYFDLSDEDEKYIRERKKIS